jgi:hypothetical protein
MRPIIFFILIFLQLDVSAEVLKYQGFDGDRNKCYFTYQTLTKTGSLKISYFDLRPLKMIYKDNYLSLFKNVLVGQIPRTDLSIIAESFNEVSYPAILNSLDMLTILETHGSHGHVWLCYDLHLSDF